MRHHVTTKRVIVCESLTAIGTRQDLLVRPLVTFQLGEASQTFPARGADVLPGTVLVPQVSGHVVGLAEGQRADGAAERFLLRVRPHVSAEFVRISEASAGAEGAVGALEFG